jgi:hypothetical protein
MDSYNQATLTQKFTPQHNTFSVQTTNSLTSLPYTALLSSNFDSGNFHLLQVPSSKPNHYIFYPCPDYSEKLDKFARNTSWFYFKVKGLPKGIKITFEARKLNILHRVFKSNTDMYRPCIKVGLGGWRKIAERPVLDVNEAKELYCMFGVEVDFDNEALDLGMSFFFWD